MQATVVAAVTLASALVVAPHSEGGAGNVPAPRVLAEPPILRDDATALVVQDVTVQRPAGSLVVAMSGPDSHGRMEITVTDTRPEDPGWSVGVGRGHASVRPTAPFVADGRSYAQTVVVNGDGVASAPAGHGLGIAHLTTTPGAQDVVSVTVV